MSKVLQDRNTVNLEVLKIMEIQIENKLKIL